MNSTRAPQRPGNFRSQKKTVMLFRLLLSFFGALTMWNSYTLHQRSAIQVVQRPSGDEQHSTPIIDRQQEHGPNLIAPIGSNSTNRHRIEILVARTLSMFDVRTTMQDIEQMTVRQFNDTHDTHVYWRLFCFQNATMETLDNLLQGHQLRHHVEIICDEGRLKTYFWHKYLRSNQIPESIQYVMLMDGDIQLAGMAWECFWRIGHETIRPAIFQPSVLSQTQSRRKSLYTHPEACEDMHGSTLDELMGIETFYAEQGIVVFRAESWAFVRSQVDREVPHWGDAIFDCGIDLVWCGMLEMKLYNKTDEALLAGLHMSWYQWRKQRNTCQLSSTNFTSLRVKNVYRGTVPPRDPVSCMIVVATPVKHLDTKSLTSVKALLQKEKHQQTLAIYRDAFPASYKYGQVYGQGHGWSKRIFVHARACQSCRKWNC